MILSLRLKISSGLITSDLMELAWSMIYTHVVSVDDLLLVAAFQDMKSTTVRLVGPNLT